MGIEVRKTGHYFVLFFFCSFFSKKKVLKINDFCRLQNNIELLAFFLL